MAHDRRVEVLVTGGSGFLGNAVIAALRKKHPLWSIVNLDIRTHTSQDDVDFIRADITSSTDLEAAFKQRKPDAIIHTAGIVPFGQFRYSNSREDRDKVFAVNYEGTKNVLDAASQAGCRIFVYTSSCTVVSDDMNHDYFAMDEEVPIGNATLLYGQSKAAAEAYVMFQTGMTACALRPATIIGPGDTGVISTMHACIAKGEMPYIVGSEDNLYDFVYISNVADAHVLALENLLCSQTAAGQVFFVSNQEPIYFRDFMVAVWAQFGHYPPYKVRIPAVIAWLAGYVAEWVTFFTGTEATLSRGSVKDALGIRYSSNEKARQLLNYVPKVGLVEAVERSCEVSLVTGDHV